MFVSATQTTKANWYLVDTPIKHSKAKQKKMITRYEKPFIHL